MAIIIKGDNKGIAVDGNLTIEHLDFQFGQGVRSASGVRRDVVDAEVVEENPIVDDRVKNYFDDAQHKYPEITDVQRNFFESAFVIKGEVFGSFDPSTSSGQAKLRTGARPTVLEMPVEWIMHAIHDETEDWNPSESTSVHKWKLLYETLRRLKYFRIEQKHRYADFVRAVVRYCFPDVADSYSNNISKSNLDEHFEDWSNDDKALYKTLKEALTFQK